MKFFNIWPCTNKIEIFTITYTKIFHKSLKATNQNFFFLFMLN